MPRLTCPSCSTKFSAPDRLAGRATRCPECQDPVRVPARAEAAPDDDDAPEVELAEHEGGGRKTGGSVWSVIRRVPVFVWFIAAPVALLFVCCGGLFLFMSTPSDELKKADKLFAAGKKGEAVAVYKQHPKYLLASDGSGTDRLRRVVDFEAEAGREAEARRWIEQATDRKLALTCESEQGKKLMAAVARERQDALAKAAADEKARQEKALAQKQKDEQERIARRDAEAARKKEEADRLARQKEEAEKLARKKEDDKWVLANKNSVTHGDVVVGVKSVRVKNVTGTDLFGKAWRSNDPYLTLRVTVANHSETKKVAYRTWGLDQDRFSRENEAILKDTFGNRYNPIRFRAGDVLGGRSTNVSIHPGFVLTDLLVFELPLKNVEALLLELPAAAFGGEKDTVIRFRVPASMIKKDD